MHLKIEGIGRLGRDPESRFTPAGQQVTNFNVATNKKYTKSSGEKVDKTIWVRISTWGKLAESCAEYLHKGSLVFFEGELNADKDSGGPRVYESQGKWRASFEITAQTVRFLSSKTEDSGQAAPSGSYGDAMAPPDSELPF